MISYETELIQQICFQSSVAVKVLGEKAATSLHNRHSEIQAASNVHELLVGEKIIDGNTFTLTHADILSIVMVPNYPATPDNRVYDWSTVERVKITEINNVS